MSTVREIRVFLSSPGDVADERAIALKVFDRLNEDPLLRDQITIRVVAWDKPGADAPLLATMTPQEAISAGLPKPSECDIVIVIFWSRMGTPLPIEYAKPDGSRYLSGTEWEYYDAYNMAKAQGKPLLVVYRRTQPVLLDPTNDPKFKKKLIQQRRVQRFFESFVNRDESLRGGVNNYTAPEDFRDKLETHLRSLIKRLLPIEHNVVVPPTSVTAADVASPYPGLRPFTTTEARNFFGRGVETDELVNLVANNRFITVFGASGSGKSSLVNAGLLPRLEGNAVRGSHDWIILHILPAEGTAHDPFLALALTYYNTPSSIRWSDVVITLC
ncbi:MAG: hypothetical protein IPK17_04625 [Chloroflexi bacterium]|uniref:nSTAND1 domain-containing NTPase n=1 Tax=Candidatus Flexifilum breve TaxID=3140694 RepID=UPI003134EBEA|nr:hypothetical protein [Chloroflexota bacterium]